MYPSVLADQGLSIVWNLCRVHIAKRLKAYMKTRGIPWPQVDWGPMSRLGTSQYISISRISWPLWSVNGRLLVQLNSLEEGILNHPEKISCAFGWKQHGEALRKLWWENQLFAQGFTMTTPNGISHAMMCLGSGLNLFGFSIHLKLSTSLIYEKRR